MSILEKWTLIGSQERTAWNAVTNKLKNFIPTRFQILEKAEKKLKKGVATLICIPINCDDKRDFMRYIRLSWINLVQISFVMA